MLDAGYTKSPVRRFGVSRTPLREVLKMLAVKDLVNLLPNRSASVVCITAFGSSRKNWTDSIPGRTA
jgi:DNA-binding FadR family transcriptional regulator